MTSVPPPGDYESSLDPRSRFLLQIAGGLSALLILVVAFAWLHGSDEASFNPIAVAAAHTERTAGAKMAVRYVYTLPMNGTVTATGLGEYNGKTGRTRLSVSVPTPTGDFDLEAVGDERVAYLRSDAFKGQLPPGDDWMGIEPALANSAETAVAGNSDLKAQLGQLRAVSGDVEMVGSEEVRGVETTRYRASFDLADYASYLRDEGSGLAAKQYEHVAQTMPTTNEVEVWVDGSDLVRRVRVTTDYLKPKPKQLRAMDMTIDYFDFGVTPTVKLPDPDTVFDATPVGRAELGILDGSREMPALTSAPPLSNRAFYARARTICVATEARLTKMKKRAQPQIERLTTIVRRNGLKARVTLEAFRTVTRGFFEPALRLARTALRRLARIAPPREKAPQYRRLMRLSALSLEIDVAETRATEVGQFALAQQLSDRLHRQGKLNKRVATQIGLSSCEGGESTVSP